MKNGKSMIAGKEFYKGFLIEEVRQQGDNSVFSAVKSYKAVLKAWPNAGRPTDVLFTGSLREVKSLILAYQKK